MKLSSLYTVPATLIDKTMSVVEGAIYRAYVAIPVPVVSDRVSICGFPVVEICAVVAVVAAFTLALIYGPQ